MTLRAIVALLILAACDEGGLTATRRDAGRDAARPPEERDAGTPPGDAATPPADAGGGIDAEPPRRFDAGLAGVACDQGGQDASSRGAEAPYGEAVVGLCRRALGCDSHWPFAAPPWENRERGTPNHKLLWRVWYYGWAREVGTPEQIDDARAFLVAFFDRQLTYGHYAIAERANEVLTTSHFQIWSNGTSCARLLAVLHDDGPLLEATGRFWRGEKALWDLLARDGSIDAPGARFHVGQEGPSNLRDTVYALITGRPLPGRAADPRAAWWNDYYNVSAWTLREVIRTGDDIGGTIDAGPADLPLLSDPLHLRARGDDYVFVFPRLRGALEPLFWVAHIDGVASYAPHADGTPVDNPYPPPELPGAIETIIPGVGAP